MKQGWIKSKLSAVTTKIGSGATPRGGGESYKATGISLIRSLNVYDEGFREAKLAKIDNAQALKLSNVTVEPHDILFNITGASIARCCLTPPHLLPARVNQHVSIIRPEKEKLDSVFLRYLLISRLYKSKLLHAGEGGSTRQAITKAQLQDFIIYYPESLVEQKRIVSILDKAFENIAIAKTNAEQNLQNAHELFESYLQSVFTKKGEAWKLQTLEEISTVFGRGKSRHRPRGDERLLGGIYPVIQTGEIANSNHYITEYTQTYNEMGLAQSKLWPKGTICIAIVGANVAETAILGFDSCFPDSVIGIVVNEKLANNEYVEFLLQSFKAILKERGKGTARDNINMGTFENQNFPFPDVTEQKRIVSKINNLAKETQHLESIYQQKIAALDELKKSLLHKAFSGEL